MTSKCPTCGSNYGGHQIASDGNIHCNRCRIKNDTVRDRLRTNPWYRGNVV